MKIVIDHPHAPEQSYRVARVQSLFNAPEDCGFSLRADLPIEALDWKIGAVVGPSGSGKSSIGRALFGADALLGPYDWPDLPMIDAIGRDKPFSAIPAALSAVGLNSIPAWLRPYRVLSTGEKFRADLARLVIEAPKIAVVDEFSSVVDRQVAKIAAFAFAKAWRKTAGQVVLLSCHYDILDWLRPDWTFDTRTNAFSGRWLRPRPAIPLQIRQTDWRFWPLFEPHHYLKLPRMIASYCYVGFIDGAPAAHVVFSTRPGLREARAARLVVLPEWQGIGVGLRFLNKVCAAWRRGLNPYGICVPTQLHTSHPGLAAALRRDPKWVQISAALYGGEKSRSRESLAKSERFKDSARSRSGFGGHFRAILGFRYVEGM